MDELRLEQIRIVLKAALKIMEMDKSTYWASAVDKAIRMAETIDRDLHDLGVRESED